MWLKELSILDCRIIESIKMELSPHVNIIFGENASGKTSILEALSILAFGRSFRSARIAEVIRYSQSSTIVSALLSDNKNSEADPMRVGVEKSREDTRIRINKETIKSQAELSRRFPLTIMHPTSYELITGGSSLRRRYIDWIAFYLYPSFHQCWARYSSLLKQRNAALKQRKQSYSLGFLTKQLCDLQPQIYKFRQDALEHLQVTIETTTPEFLKAIVPSLKITTGYPADVSMTAEDTFNYHQSKEHLEIKRGATLYGAHISNLEITIEDILVSKVASRGQIKLITLLLLISQNLSLDKPGVIVIDDLDSELDKSNQQQLIKFLASLDQQLFITSTDKDLHKQFDEFDMSMFHVEQGKIHKVDVSRET